MKIDSVILCGLILCCVTFFLVSCGGKTDNTVRKSQENIATLSCVVLLPTEIPLDDPTTDPLEKENLLDGADFFYTTLKSQLKQSEVGKVIDPRELNLQINEVAGGMNGVIKFIGSQAQCNNVLVTNLDRFNQRQGGEYAVDSPASAAFELRLMQADSGNSLWSVSFSETQVSLLSNLFSFNKAQSRGFKWITVEQLVAKGVEEKLLECPYFY